MKLFIHSSRQNASVPALFILAGAFVFLYHHVIAKLVHDWMGNDNFSHGFLIVPLAAYFAWERRREFRLVLDKPSGTGLLLVLAGIAALFAGNLGAELFLTRISMLVVLAGAIVFLFGWRHLRAMAFPILFLLLMIPMPEIIFNRIAFPLQLLASRLGETALLVCRIPVLREGNIIVLLQTRLEVAEACSGIRSLVSLLSLGIVYGYFSDSRLWVRIILALSTVPIAIMANGIRIAGTGIAAHFFGAKAAEGFFHHFSGWIMFVAAFAFLFFLHKVLCFWRTASQESPD
jgi:exosortase